MGCWDTISCSLAWPVLNYWSFPIPFPKSMKMGAPPHPQRRYLGFLESFPLPRRDWKQHPLHRIHPADENRVAASHLTGPGKPSKPVQKSWRQSFWITSAAAECSPRSTNTDQSLVQAGASIPGWVHQLSAGATHLPAGLTRPGHAPPTHTDCANLWATRDNYSGGSFVPGTESQFPSCQRQSLVSGCGEKKCWPGSM